MQLGIFFFILLTAYGAFAEDACPQTEIVKLIELYTNPNLHECQKISANVSTASPTDSQVKVICASDPCRTLIKDVLAIEPADCYLTIGKQKINAYKLASTFDDACKTDKDKTHDGWTSQSTLNVTDDKQHPTPMLKGNTTDHLKHEKLKLDEDVDGMHIAGNDKVEDADELKPPFNISAKELYPMPNTTYKANVLKMSNKP